MNIVNLKISLCVEDIKEINSITLSAFYRETNKHFEMGNLYKISLLLLTICYATPLAANITIDESFKNLNSTEVHRLCQDTTHFDSSNRILLGNNKLVELPEFNHNTLGKKHTLYIYTHTHTHTYISLYIYMCIYIHIYIYIYIYFTQHCRKKYK